MYTYVPAAPDSLYLFLSHACLFEVAFAEKPLFQIRVNATLASRPRDLPHLRKQGKVYLGLRCDR